MAARGKVLAVASVAACAVGALALTWTWVGRGADPDWDTCENWNWSTLDPCWPSVPTDNVVIALGSDPHEPWPVNLISEQIGDMAIHASVNFGPAGSDRPTLEVKGDLTIQSLQGEEIVLTMSGANIVTVP